MHGLLSPILVGTVARATNADPRGREGWMKLLDVVPAIFAARTQWRCDDHLEPVGQGSFAMMALARATTSGLMASAVRPDGTLTWRSRECLLVQTISSA